MRTVARNCLYLLRQLLLLKSDSQHVWQGFTALLIENVIHEWWALWQDLQAQRDAVHVIVCNWLLGQRGLAQMQHSNHDEHGLRDKGLKQTADVRRAAKQIRAKGYSHFAFFFLEQYQRNARPLWWVWWPRTLPRKSLHPSGSLWAEVWIKRSGDYWEFEWSVPAARCARRQFVPVLFLFRGPGGAESALCHVSAHFCHQLLSWSCAHFILWFQLSRLFLYFIFYNWNLSKRDIYILCLTYLGDLWLGCC